MKEDDFQEIIMVDFEKPNKAKKVETVTESQARVVNKQRYVFLLERAKKLFDRYNPQLGNPNQKLELRAVHLQSNGRKSVITNFEDLCRYVNRHPDHVMDYFNNELGRKGSMGNYGYMIKLQKQPRQIQTLYSMYATEYVRCHACHRINTDLVKDEMIRKWMLVCRDCKCTRTISVTLKASEKNFADYEKEKKEWKRKAMENAE